MALHEHFREYTPEEIIEIKKKVCIKNKCPYMANTTSVGSVRKASKTTIISNKCCMYILWAGKSRGCMPDECKHYMDKDVKRPTNLLIN